MLFSREWIGQYVELPEDPSELAQRLTAAGLAVDDQEVHGDDVVYEIDITTNRPDAMNHLGLAREAAVLFDRPLRPPVVEPVTEGESATDCARLVIEDFDDCPRYDALVIRDITVGPSPEWMARRLEAIGLRPINNIVDITNYVLWETGQPLHAFDLERIDPEAEIPEIRVRRAREGETLLTLDGETRKLTPEMLVVANAKEAIGLGGVMGGLDSEVTESTRHVLLEAGHFAPKIVRRCAKNLGMHTDASHRYERGADPEACLYAAQRAAALMAELGGGRVLAGHLEEKRLSEEWPPRVTIEYQKLLAFGGVDIPSSEVERTLEGLGFELETRTGDAAGWQVTVPSWRYYDFHQAYPADVYEEVLRIHGLDDIESTLPQIGGADAPERPEHTVARKIRDHLAASGLAEAINFGFHDRETDTAYPSLYDETAPLALANPLSDRYAVMRRSLLPNLVASARYNQRRGAEAVRLFEVGHIFAEAEGNACQEQETLAVVVGGQLGTPWERQTPIDFFDLKGILESLADLLGFKMHAQAAEIRGLTPGASAELLVEGDESPIGFLGELALGEGPYTLFVAEVATKSLVREEIDLSTQAPSRFPGIVIDATLTHAVEVPWEQIADAIDALEVNDLVQFGLKDRYQGKGVPQGAVNTTLSFLYNAEGRSLTHDEVNERHRHVAAELEQRFGHRADT